MNRQLTAHLDYDQLLKALVDTADLEDSVQIHLEACSACQRQVAHLAQRYDRLGQMAKKMTPQPTRAFRLPDRSASKSRMGFRPVFAMGIVAAMIMVFTVWGTRNVESPDAPTVPMVAQDSEGDDLLMADIDALVADALPAAYQELASVFDPESDEDLIEWIVPTIEEDDEFDPRA